MPKFSLKLPVGRSKEAGPISIKETKVIKPGNMRMDKVSPARVTFLGPDGKPLAKEILEKRQKNAETLKQRLGEKGIDYDAYHACFAGCPVAALCNKPQKQIFTEESSQKETQPSLIINMDGLDKPEPIPQKNRRATDVKPELKIRYVKQVETVEQSVAALKQDIKPIEPTKINVETIKKVKPPIKIPEAKITKEVPVQPVKIVNKKSPVPEKERPDHVDPSIPRELPQALIKKFWQRRQLIETPPKKENKPPSKTQPVLETFKDKVNEFFTEITKQEIKPVKETPVKKPLLIKKGGVQRIFDRLIHFERIRKKPLVKELKRAKEKIDFSRALKLDFVTLLPLQNIDKKMKRRLSRLIKHSLVNRREKLTKKTQQKVDTKIESKTVFKKGFKPEAAKQTRTQTEALVTKIKEILSQEKQLSFALIVLPILKESPVGKRRQEEEFAHEVIPINEKTFFKLISLSEKLSKAINSLSLKENVRIINKLLILDVENILPSEEEIKTTLKTYSHNTRLILWYMSRVLLSFNRLNFYLSEA